MGVQAHHGVVRLAVVVGVAEVVAVVGGHAVIQVTGALAAAVRAVDRRVSGVVLVGHRTLVGVGVDVAVDRTVDRQLTVVRPDAVALLIRVGEDAALQHLVRGEAHARNQVGRVQSNLLDLVVVVLRVTVELEVTDLDARVVLLGPDLGQVEGVEAVVFCLIHRHDLHVDVPLREVAALDGVPQVLAVIVGVDSGHLGGLGVGEVLDALLADEVVLDPEGLAGGVDPLEGVGAVAVHVAVGLRGAAAAHQVGDLVRGLRRAGPEVPLHVGGAQAVGLQALLRVDEVRELHGVADEEDRGVVAHDVVVAVLGVVAHGEAVHVTPGVRGAGLAGDRGEADAHRGDGARLEQLGLGVLGDVLGHVQLTEGAVALGVRDAVRDHFAVEVGQLLHEVDVIEDDRTLLALGDRMIFGRDRGAVVAGGVLVRGVAATLRQNVVDVCHGVSPLG